MMRNSQSRNTIRPSSSLTQKSRVSNIIFRKNLSHTQIDKLLKTNLQYKKLDWTFNFKAGFKKEDPTQIFLASETILIQRLVFHYCENKKILKIISQINFPRLQCLSLPSNNIQSWEPLSSINLQNLNYIELRENNCLTGKSLVRCNFNNLNGITLPNFRVESVENIFRRSKFPNKITQCFVQFQKKANIYGFICSLLFKDQNWIQEKIWIVIQRCGIQYNVFRKILSQICQKSGINAYNLNLKAAQNYQN